MKRYDYEDLRVMAISPLKKKAEENPDRTEISWIRNSRFPGDLGKATQITLSPFTSSTEKKPSP